MNFRFFFFFFTSRSGIFFVNSLIASLITACGFSSKNYSGTAGARPITMWRPTLVVDFLVNNKPIRVFIILILPVTNILILPQIFLLYLTSAFAVYLRDHSFWPQPIIILLKRQENWLIKASSIFLLYPLKSLTAKRTSFFSRYALRIITWMF